MKEKGEDCFFYYYLTASRVFIFFLSFLPFLNLQNPAMRKGHLHCFVTLKWRNGDNYVVFSYYFSFLSLYICYTFLSWLAPLKSSSVICFLFISSVNSHTPCYVTLKYIKTWLYLFSVAVYLYILLICLFIFYHTLHFALSQ